jgi:hypothetical protein
VVHLRSWFRAPPLRRYPSRGLEGVLGG